MSDATRRCPQCDHPVLGLTTSDEVASCPNCGRFFDHYRPAVVDRWPALWKIAIMLCGPMTLVVLLRAGQWWALRAGQKTLAGVFGEMYPIGVPLAWFAWPLLGAFLLARKYAPAPDRWMTSLGLAIAAMVGNTVVMLASMLVRAIF